MQKWLLFLMLLFALPLRAEETEEADLLAPEAAAVATEKNEDDKISVVLPECNDQNLLRQVEILAGEYNDGHQVSSLLERRRRILQLRSMSEYTEENISDFTTKENRVVADKLLMTKINQGLSDSQIRLCKSKVKGKGLKAVYLMIYQDKDGQTHVHVLNYIENQSEDLSLVL